VRPWQPATDAAAAGAATATSQAVNPHRPALVTGNIEHVLRQVARGALKKRLRSVRHAGASSAR